MKKNINKGGQYIKDFAKANPVTTIVIGGVLFFVIRAQVKKLLEPKPPEPKPIPPVPEPTPAPNPVPNPQGGGGGGYSYDSAQYDDWASGLQAAFDGIGTNFSTLKRIFGKMKVRFDLLALNNAYGKRVITTPYGWDSSAMSLPETLDYELDAKEIAEINDIIKKTGYSY
jgi:hypothetical protein